MGYRRNFYKDIVEESGVKRTCVFGVPVFRKGDAALNVPKIEKALNNFHKDAKIILIKRGRVKIYHTKNSIEKKYMTIARGLKLVPKL